jgi:hypothetical protein
MIEIDADTDEYDLAMHWIFKVCAWMIGIRVAQDSEIADFDFLNTKDEDLDDPDGWNFDLC